MAKGTLSLCVAALAAACSTDAERFDTPLVSEGIRERTDHAIEAADGPFPASVSVEDGITEDEAVTVALWNNPGFREALAELGLKRADLIQAGLLSNPVLSFLFPLGPKQLEFAVTLPTEVFWLRPARIDAATLDAERVASLLVQDGLNLIRDVRARYADLEEAGERADLTAELVVLNARLAGLTGARLQAGDASLRELAEARARVREARIAADAALFDGEVARVRISGLMGLSAAGPAFRLETGSPSIEPADRDDADLVHLALASRPDLRAAELATQAATVRAGLADSDWFTLSTVLDANQRDDGGVDVGPGLELPIPILNQSQGRAARAQAELEIAARRYVTVKNRVAQEVREARLRWLQSREALDLWASGVIPALEEAHRRAVAAQRDGETSTIEVVQARMRLVEAKLGARKGKADMLKARAELERSVGRRLP